MFVIFDWLGHACLSLLGLLPLCYENLCQGAATLTQSLLSNSRQVAGNLGHTINTTSLEMYLGNSGLSYMLTILNFMYRIVSWGYPSYCSK